jgi:hypothetical protein
MDGDDIFWFGGRNYYLAEWGEYELASGWTFTHQMGKFFVCELHVSPRYSSREHKPSSFYAHLGYGSVRLRIAEGKCRSIKQAKSITEEALKDEEHIEKLHRLAFDSEKACKVFRKDNGEYNGYCSVMGCFSGYSFQKDVLGIGYGDFIKVFPDGRLRQVCVDTWSEVSSSPSEDERNLFKGVALGESDDNRYDQNKRRTGFRTC